jgi:DNA-binding NarL/FixJ family response regulator
MHDVGEVKNTPVVVISALNQPEDRAKATSLGVAGYIAKGENTPADSAKIIETTLGQFQFPQPSQPPSQGVDSEPPHL